MLNRAVRVWAGAVQPEWKVTVAAAVSKTETAHELDLSDDRALVRAYLAGNQPAFDVLVERHRRPSINSATASWATTKMRATCRKTCFCGLTGD